MMMLCVTMIEIMSELAFLLISYVISWVFLTSFHPALHRRELESKTQSNPSSIINICTRTSNYNHDLQEKSMDGIYARVYFIKKNDIIMKNMFTNC